MKWARCHHAQGEVVAKNLHYQALVLVMYPTQLQHNEIYHSSGCCKRIRWRKYTPWRWLHILGWPCIWRPPDTERLQWQHELLCTLMLRHPGASGYQILSLTLAYHRRQRTQAHAESHIGRTLPCQQQYETRGTEISDDKGLFFSTDNFQLSSILYLGDYQTCRSNSCIWC